MPQVLVLIQRNGIGGRRTRFSGRRLGVSHLMRFSSKKAEARCSFINLMIAAPAHDTQVLLARQILEMDTEVMT